MCSNNLVGRMDAIDAEVIATLQDDVCRPTVIEEAVRLALDAFAPERQEASREARAAELATVRQECERLAEAIGRGGPLEALLARLAERQAQREALEREIATLAIKRPHVDLRPLEARLRDKLADWRGLLQRNVREGRAVLRALLVGPLRFTPIVIEQRRGYKFEGAIALDRLLVGVVDLPTKVASPRRNSELYRRLRVRFPLAA